MQRNICFLASAVLLASAGLASAVTIHVPADQPTIQAGINTAVSGDTVLVGPGTYSEDMVVSGKSLVVRSEQGTLTTVITPPHEILISTEKYDVIKFSGFTVEGSPKALVLQTSVASAVVVIEGNRFTSIQGDVLVVGWAGVIRMSGNLFDHNNTSNPTYSGAYFPVLPASSSSITNNTIVNNGYGLYGALPTYIRNNIIAWNLRRGIVRTGGSALAEYNDVFANSSGDYDGIVPGVGSLSLDPLFVDTAAADYHLKSWSPCVDAGDPDPQYNDLDGTRNDMGAFWPPIGDLPLAKNLNLGPDHAGNVVNHTPTLYWSFYDTAGSQSAIKIEVGTDTLWDVAEMWASGQLNSSDTSIAYAGSPLADGSTYYWRVRLNDGVKWGVWVSSTFHMNSKPSVPTLNAPIARALLSTNAVRLYVNNSSDVEGDPISYDFQIYTDSNLTSLVANKGNIPQTANPTGSGLFPPLTLGFVYWWRARAYDGYEYSDWSSAEPFITRTGTIHVPAERPTIASGIAEAFDGDTVLLAHGTYAEQINPLGKAIVIQGTAPPESTVVIKTTDGADLVTIASGEGSGTVIGGLTIQGAVNANGIRVTGSSPQILGNIIKGNAASANGGGILVASGNPIIRGNQILSNTAIGKGGGVFLASGASATVDSNVFYFNSCTDGGGAIAKIGSGNLTVTRNVMYGNSNTDDWGGVIYTEQAPGFLIDHNTIAGNSATASRGAGITNLSPQGGQISNNVIAFNKGGYGVYVLVSGGTAPQVTYNDLWANETGTYFGVTPGTGSITSDPLFCDTTARDFRVATGSPCLGTGQGGTNIGAMGLGCSFTGPQPPTISGLVVDYPNNQNRLVNHTPVMAWRYHDPGSRPHTKSEIQVGTDNDWSVAEMWQPPVMTGPDTSIQYTGAPLVDGLTYWVRARVRSDTAWSDWLAVSFHMNAPPTAPVLLSPIQDSIVHTGRPTLRIGLNSSDPDADPVYYSFEVYRDSSLTLLADFMPLVWATSWTTDSLTAENQRHWWRARASDGYENGPWSTVQTFRVDAYNQPPAGFNLQSPLDGANVTDLTPTFAWDAAVDPDPGASLTYTVTIGLNPGFTFKSEVSGITDTTFDWADSLTLGSTYWWKVKADDGRGGTVTSAVRSFKAASPCDCPSQGDLAQNGFIDVQDVLKVIGIAFVNGTDIKDPGCPKTRGDVNNSGAVDVNDVLYIVKTAFTNGPAPVNPCGP